MRNQQENGSASLADASSHFGGLDQSTATECH
jgi:hypothetical protein